MMNNSTTKMLNHSTAQMQRHSVAIPSTSNPSILLHNHQKKQSLYNPPSAVTQAEQDVKTGAGQSPGADDTLSFAFSLAMQNPQSITKDVKKMLLNKVKKYEREKTALR